MEKIKMTNDNIDNAWKSKYPEREFYLDENAPMNEILTEDAKNRFKNMGMFPDEVLFEDLEPGELDHSRAYVDDDDEPLTDEEIEAYRDFESKYNAHMEKCRELQNKL